MFRLPQIHGRRPINVVASSVSRLVVLLGLFFVVGCAHQASGPAALKTYAFWPDAPDDPHVQFLVSYNTSSDVAPARSKFDEILYGKGDGLSIIKPYGIAMYNGCIYVTDLRNPGVIVLDIAKHQTRVMGVGGTADVQKAIAIAIAPEGTKYVIDSAHNTIVVFDAQEKYLTTFAQKDFNPVDLAIYQKELYVSDYQAAVVRVLDRTTGRLLRTIGKPGGNDGEFIHPLSIRIDNDGNVLVADVYRCRIQKFTRDGQLLMAFGQTGNRPGDFVRPKHMAIDKEGFIYVVDAAFDNVQVFDPQGKIVGFFGSRGTHAGSMDLPAGLCISETDVALFQQYVHPAFDAQRLIIVSNQFGANKIAVYAEGTLKPGKTVADINPVRVKIDAHLQPAGAAPTSQPITIGVPLPEEALPPSSQPATAPAAR